VRAANAPWRIIDWFAEAEELMPMTINPAATNVEVTVVPV
jgi:hypothetical protein